MSKLKATALLGLVDSDDEGSDILSSAHKPSHAMAPRGKIIKPSRITTTTKPLNATTTGPRKVLAEKPKNIRENPMAGKGRKRAAPEELPASASNRQDENAIEMNSKPKASRGRPRAVKAPKVTDDEDEISELQPEPPAAQPPPAKRGRKPKAKVGTAAATEPEIPETQPQEPEIPETQYQHPEAMELSVDDEEEIDGLLAARRTGISSVQRVQSHNLFGPSHRTISASDSEHNDPSVRRRVGDLTRKYQELEAKYRDLREIGVKEAEHNYDRLKQQSEEKSNSKSFYIYARVLYMSTANLFLSLFQPPMSLSSP